MEPTTKTWGPFNGRQLTTIVCAFTVAMLFPFGAWAAVSFTNVSITDPGGVNRAKVDASGKLAVGDGSGPLTVDGSNSPSLPAKPITIPKKFLTQTAATVYGPQTKPFGITSITVTNLCSAGIEFGLLAVVSTGGVFQIEGAWVATNSTVHLAFPSPLVSTPPPGGTVTLQAAAGPLAGTCAYMEAVGIQS